MSRNIFNTVKLPKIGSNTFDLTHDVKMSFRMGQLVPSCVMDVLPGDRVRISVQNMLRFAPLLSPVMHRIKVTTHYFFVPNRILWPNFEKFITGSEDVEPPWIPVDGNNVGSLIDYMGLPQTGSGTSLDVSAFPFAAYAKIYDEYYRDQNLQDELYKELIDGDNSAGSSFYSENVFDPPLNRAWQHDYFTGALPFAQKGDSVSIPLGTFSDVDIIKPSGAAVSDIIRKTADGELATSADLQTNAAGFLSHNGTNGAYIDPVNWKAQTSSLEAEAATINTLRRAFKLQEFLERDARGGTRMTETLLAQFGKKSSDARLQRPEYIGGSRQNMVISEVLSTAESEGTPVGDLKGHGISVGGGNYFNYNVEEWGWIIGIINVQPDTAYQQGVHRSWSRVDRLDYMWPPFQHIGEQEVLNKEVYSQHTSPDDTFGYVPRYAEYKYMNSRVAGEFKTSLAHWHLGRIFSGDPSLNEAFIKSDPSTRIFAVPSADDHIYAHVLNKIKAIRKMAVYGNPSF